MLNHSFSTIARIIAIDPGIHHIGLSKIYYDYTEKTIDRIESQSIHTAKLDRTNLIYDTHTDREVLIDKLTIELTDIFHEVDPHVVVCEAPFYNPRMPNAFKALIEAVQTIKIALYGHSYSIPFHLFPPGEIKKAVNVSSHRGKDPMRDAISKLIDNEILSVPLEELDEHAVDSIAIGYTFLALKTDFLSTQE